MDKQFIEAKVEKAGGKVTFVASDESVDRHGDKLKVDMWDLKNFKKAPRLLVDHWPMVENIVGRAKNIRVEGKKLLFEPEFHDITELARTVKAMVEQGVLDTVSVGFMMLEDAYELLEISFVALPANVNARMVKALEVKPGAVEIEKIKDFMGEPNMAAVLDSINELKTKTTNIEQLVEGSLARPVKRQVEQARHEAKLSVETLKNLNRGLRDLLIN